MVSSTVWVFAEVGVQQGVVVSDVACKHTVQSFWFSVGKVIQLEDDKFVYSVRVWP